MYDFKLSFYNVITDIINPEQVCTKQIIFSTRTGKSATIDTKIIEKLTSNKLEEISMSVLKELIDMEILVPSDESELDTVLESNKAAIADNTELGIVIQPGASCQLGCGYCGQKHSKTYMNADLQDLMFERIKTKLETNKFKTLTITWYGGEPLMALKQIREISPRLIELCLQMNIAYYSSMITNALSLKEEIFKELVTVQKVTNFQITVDGDAEYHDKRRFTKELHPTFDIIFNNILNITKLPDFETMGGEIVIRCNADKNNIDGIIPFIHKLVENNLQKKVNFYIAPIHNWGDNGAAEKEGVGINEFATLEIDWMLELIKLGFPVKIIPERSKIVCMVVNNESEVYDAFGNISTCWEVPYTPIYENTENYIGNLKFKAPNDDKKAPMRNWNDTIREGKTWCRDCNILPICGGQCPKHWLDGTPACPTYKFNIEDRLIMQYINNTASLKTLTSQI
jgi:uncharacterized protein